MSPAAWAAGSAYVVDDAAVGPRGECKVETWAGFADNDDTASDDAVFVAGPACSFGRVEIGVQGSRARAADEWTDTFGAKAKGILIPTERWGVGVGVAGGITYAREADDLATGFVYAPVTVEPTEDLRLNFNLGWLRDIAVAKHFLTWGAGVEWEARPRFTLIAEIFGRDEGRSGWQAGPRWTPFDNLDLDVILGRDVTGVPATWLTFGVTLRFGG
jgi:hypothetical protein